MKKFLLFLVVVSYINTTAQKVKTLTNNGAWCWFSAPNAIYNHQQKGDIITGWVTQDGSIEAACLNINNDDSVIEQVSAQLDKDDHANPSFLELDNGNILMSYTKHFDQFVRLHSVSGSSKTLNVGELQRAEAFNEEQFKLYPKKCVTYANPIQLKKEKGRIFIFGRWTGYKPNVIWSDNDGQSFNDAQVFITNKPFNDSNRPYVRYFSNGKSKIHMVFTDGHPRVEPTNSVYYACYENEAFWRADGTKICDLENIPFEPKEATIVYKADEKSGRAWVYDITEDKKGNPVILYARYPSEKEHLYHYAYLKNDKWIDHQLCNSGKWFPQTPENGYEREPHYSGGMTFDPLKTNTVYLSRKVNGVFEIEKWTTDNGGESWDKMAITSNSEFDNVRPVVPKNMKKGDKPVVLWMVNEKYVHYTDYKTRIDYFVE